jgi:hypothetical protein
MAEHWVFLGSGCIGSRIGAFAIGKCSWCGQGKYRILKNSRAERGEAAIAMAILRFNALIQCMHRSQAMQGR